MPRHQALRDLLFRQPLKFLLYALRRCKYLLTASELVSELLKPVSEVAEAQLVRHRLAVALLDLVSHLIKCINEHLDGLSVVLLAQIVRYIGPKAV